MFEFDEHFEELEALDSETPVVDVQDQNLLPAWTYLGHDIWKLDLEANALQTQDGWRLQIADMT